MLKIQDVVDNPYFDFNANVTIQRMDKEGNEYEIFTGDPKDMDYHLFKKTIEYMTVRNNCLVIEVEED